jgi:hypothetical protein
MHTIDDWSSRNLPRILLDAALDAALNAALDAALNAAF